MKQDRVYKVTLVTFITQYFSHQQNKSYKENTNN